MKKTTNIKMIIIYFMFLTTFFNSIPIINAKVENIEIDESNIISDNNSTKIVLNIKNIGKHVLTSINITAMINIDNYTRVKTALLFNKYLLPEETTIGLIEISEPRIDSYSVMDISYITTDTYTYTYSDFIVSKKIVHNLDKIIVLANITNNGIKLAEDVAVTSIFLSNNTYQDYIKTEYVDILKNSTYSLKIEYINKTLIDDVKIIVESTYPIEKINTPTYARWLLLLGLLPMYISAIFVERHYTNFWTALWNIWGLIIVSVGLIIENYNVTSIVISNGGLIFCAFYLWITVFDSSDLVRNIGSSVLISSFTWLLWFWFKSSLILGIIAGVVNFIILILVTGYLNS